MTLSGRHLVRTQKEEKSKDFTLYLPHDDVSAIHYPRPEYNECTRVTGTNTNQDVRSKGNLLGCSGLSIIRQCLCTIELQCTSSQGSEGPESSSGSR